MKKVIAVLAVLILVACSGKEDIPDVLARNYQIKTIADSGASAPFNFEENNYGDFIVLFHYNFAPEQIKKYFNLSDSLFNERINTLYGNRLIKKGKEGEWIPGFPVIDSKDDKAILGQADSLAPLVAEIIIDRYEKIKNEYSGIPGLKAVPFEKESLMILSGAMLNGEQMKYIENNFIQDEKPLRGNARFYAAALENSGGPGVQPYGLYDFRIFVNADSVFCVYGDKINGTAVENQRAPVISKSDFESMLKLSDIISEDLLNYFNARRTGLVSAYLNSGMSDESSFKEYFIWLYRLISVKATDILIEKKYIVPPPANTNEVIISDN